MAKDSETDTVKKRIEVWWAEFQKKGEKTVLIEGALAGNAQHAARLVEKYPKDALAVLEKAVEGAKAGWVRANLIRVAAELPGDEPLPLLRKELRDGPELGSRLAAAWALQARGERSALEAMIGEWKKLDSKSDEWRSAEGLLRFLIHSGDPAAISALGERWKERPVSLRCEIVQSLGWSGETAPVDSETHEKALAAAEALLVAALDDPERYMGMSSAWPNGKSMSDPRICDCAGSSLARRWKEKYPYDPSAPIEERERARVVCKNIWRKERGLEALPLPAKKAIAPAPDSETAPGLEKLCSDDESARSEGRAALTALGLRALEAVSKKAASLDAGSAARGRLEALARELSLVVSEIQLEPGSGELPDTARKALAALEKKPLTFERFAAALDALMTEKPTNCGVEATRAGDGTGVVLHVSYVPGAKKAESWTQCFSVSADGKALTGGFGGGSGTGAQTCEHLKTSIEEALATPPATTLEIRVLLK